jgi:hypothetical protein
LLGKIKGRRGWVVTVAELRPEIGPPSVDANFIRYRPWSS